MITIIAPEGTATNTIIGKVNDYRSAWTMQNGSLRISQELKVKFKVLLFSKSFKITSEFTGHRGSGIAGLMKSAEKKTP